MDPIYVCGHRNPDTDSVVSAMAFAALHNALGDNAYVAAMQGAPNDETQFLLDRFGFQAPTLLTNVRTQVRDIDYDRPPTLGTSVPISHAWAVLREDENLSAVPVTNEDGTLYGMLTAGGIAEKDMESITKPEVRDVPIFNLLSALEGHIINNEEDTFDTISGEVVIALPTPGECLKGVGSGSIVICGQQKDVVDKALEIGASCVIICQGSLSEKYLGLSSKTCIIATPCDAYRAARMIYQAIPVQRIAQHTGVVLFHLNDFIDDVRETVLQSRYRSYPVLDENEKVVGTLSRYHLLRPRRKRVVLVDHNEKAWKSIVRSSKALILMFGMSARCRIPLLVLHDVHNRAVRAAHADADQLAQVRNQAVKAVIQNAVLRVDTAAFQRQTRRFHRKPRAQGNLARAALLRAVANHAADRAQDIPRSLHHLAFAAAQQVHDPQRRAQS